MTESDSTRAGFYCLVFLLLLVSQAWSRVYCLPRVIEGGSQRGGEEAQVDRRRASYR